MQHGKDREPHGGRSMGSAGVLLPPHPRGDFAVSVVQDNPGSSCCWLRTAQCINSQVQRVEVSEPCRVQHPKAVSLQFYGR